jgi:hypothetical protein
MLFNIHAVILLALALMATASPAEVDARPEMNLKRRSKGNDDLTEFEQLAMDYLVANAAYDTAHAVVQAAEAVRTAANNIRTDAKDALLDVEPQNRDTPDTIQLAQDALADLVNQGNDAKSTKN